MDNIALKGRDIELWIDRTPAKGVLEFCVKESASYTEVSEYLSSSPVSRRKGRSKYLLTLRTLSLFGELPERPFTVSVRWGDTEQRYENCALLEKQTQCKGDSEIQIVYTIESDHRVLRRDRCGI